jgi:hypothetical protein
VDEGNRAPDGSRRTQRDIEAATEAVERARFMQFMWMPSEK